jgi:hypothetical protein
LVFYLTNLAFPVSRIGDMDEVDVYGTFTPEEAKKLGVIFVSSIDGSVTLDEKTPSRQDRSSYVPE